MPAPRISLEQWRALLAVVDEGSYARAAKALHKSQSSVTYAVQKLESLLGVKAFKVQGRKAGLTPTGELLYRRARYLLDEATGLEHRGAGLDRLRCRVFSRECHLRTFRIHWSTATATMTRMPTASTW